MPRKGHSEEQIVYALRQIEGGKKVTEVCRELGVSPQAVLQMEAQIRGIGIERSARASATAGRESQAEGIVADLKLDKHILQEVLSKKA
jgi:putative transposase